mmetsp:Transcript_111346/g.309548  ORF Transcript_111346/g.309548 Transcript_111346/m.309548 type:complete len:221 (-) Transcript_111346:397-1059(-)
MRAWRVEGGGAQLCRVRRPAPRRSRTEGWGTLSSRPRARTAPLRRQPPEVPPDRSDHPSLVLGCGDRRKPLRAVEGRRPARRCDVPAVLRELPERERALHRGRVRARLLPLEVLLEHDLRIVAELLDERLAARAHEPEDERVGVDVDAVGVLLEAHHLGGHVSPRADAARHEHRRGDWPGLGARHLWRHQLADPEVRDLQLLVPSEEEVQWLQVTMYNGP